MSVIPCSLYGSILMRKGSTEEPFKALTTTNACNILLLLLLLRCLKKTILRLWLERTERRTESEGKEWVSAFPGGVTTWGMRGEKKQKWEESWGIGQIGPRLSFRKSPHLNVKHGCCRFGHKFEQKFVLDKKLQIATKKEPSWCWRVPPYVL